MTIDLTNFTDKEKAGLATLTRITEDAFAVAFKKFDASTGEELSEEVMGGNTKELTDKKAELQGQIDQIDAFLKKFDALEPQNE